MSEELKKRRRTKEMKNFSNEDKNVEKEKFDWKKELKKYEEALRAATVERSELLSKIDNLKKEIVEIKLAANDVAGEKSKLLERLEEEKKEILKYRANDFLLAILPTIDMLESALSSKGVSDEVKAWLSGFEMILKNFKTALESEGVEEIEATRGADFDHNLHHAIEEVATNNVEPGKIVEVKQKGYKLKDRLLRPTRVVVAKTEEAKSESVTKETSTNNDVSKNENDEEGFIKKEDLSKIVDRINNKESYLKEETKNKHNQKIESEIKNYKEKENNKEEKTWEK